MSFEMISVKKISRTQSIWIDFIRGISAQLVLLGHLLAFSGIQSRYKLPIVQNFGVLVFFVLSGYLITQTTLLKGRGYGFSGYLIDRFARIFFSFLPALILVSVFDFLFIEDLNSKYNNSTFNWVANLFMIQALPFHSLLNIEAYGSARVFWTVSVEWWFYLFFGINFFKGLKRREFYWPILPIFSVSSFFVLFYFGFRGNGLSVYWMIGLGLSILWNSSNTQLVISKKNGQLICGSIFLILLVRTYIN